MLSSSSHHRQRRNKNSTGSSALTGNRYISFPMLSLLPGEKPALPSNMDPEPDLFSWRYRNHWRRQNSRQRNTVTVWKRAWLLTSSLLHCWGYDHEGGEQQAAEMRNRRNHSGKVGTYQDFLKYNTVSNYRRGPRGTDCP